MRNYGKALECGHRHILQGLPRLLTLLFELGSHLLRQPKYGNKERVTLSQVRGGLQAQLRCYPTLNAAASLLHSAHITSAAQSIGKRCEDVAVSHSKNSSTVFLYFWPRLELVAAVLLFCLADLCQPLPSRAAPPADNPADEGPDQERARLRLADGHAAAHLAHLPPARRRPRSGAGGGAAAGAVVEIKN